MIPIIKWTLWQRKTSIIWWSIGVASLIFITLIFYPSFKDEAAQLQRSFENLPDAAVQLFGGSTDFFSPIGFLNSQLYFIVLPLVLAILAIGLGSSLVAQEEQSLNIELLLGRPISRSKLLLAKSLAGGLILTFVTLVGLVATIVTAKLVDLEVATSLIALVTLDCLLLTLCFGAIALVITMFGKARSASLGIATFIALGGYIISSLAGTVDWLETPSKIFPFHYYQSEAILRETYNWTNSLFFIAVIAVCGAISWFVFRQRDLG